MKDWILRIDRGLLMVIAVILVLVVGMIVSSSGTPTDARDTATVTPVPTRVPTAMASETSYGDLLVWRTCSAILNGTVTREHLTLIYGLGMSTLNSNARSVAKLIRDSANSFPNIDPDKIQQIQGACTKWREDDSKGQ